MNSKKLKKIKLVVLDVDGVLTDGRVWISSNGDEMLAFDIKDGMGISQLMEHRIEVAILTGRNSKAVIARADALGISKRKLGIKNKITALKELAEESGCSLEEMAYIGDDIADIEPMKAVGISAAVADAVQEVAKIADIVLTRKGGRGAVREFADMIIQQRKKNKKAGGAHR